MAYTKLANSILTSTIWMESDQTRIVWLTLLAMADKNGEVQASIPGLANIARVPVQSCREAIAKFLSPDLDSRTKDDEGRRIEEMKGGWLLINHAEYRDLASDEDRKRKAAERQQKVRDRKARNGIVTPASRQIPQADTKAHTEAEAEAYPKAKAETNTYNDDDGRIVFSAPSIEEFMIHFSKELEPFDKGGHLTTDDWLEGQHTFYCEKWEARPPKNWKNIKGALIQNYTAHWKRTEPTETAGTF